ncbi:hypothetical protein MVES1_001222 [Malassezia vespertilionis]|uniref:Uncharacterized protein n=1 Tax=Malassezia vespertilionis TaxID=2020962 RepID=A0A2N1JDY2_9BASI|nr:uncharacterized protein MVES1_001222 [Malassezia vespertilionis]PKI84742.1 hypothetical protein MVES_001151 [Malassezia vespertilionis]WFD05888.1 hypothetical protein MVES1_001222 [Malassezia vespertilionis]
MADVLEQLAIAGLISFASIWGVLARFGLNALNTYDGESVIPILWAQSIGCFIMGFTTHPKVKGVLEHWYKPLFPMITTGFCGSVTSYSAWVYGAFQAYSNQLHYNRHGLHNTMDALTQSIATLGLAYGAYKLGKNIGALGVLQRIQDWILRKLHRDRTPASHEEPIAEKKGFNGSVTAHLVSIAIGIVFWAATAILCGTYPPFRNVTYALVLAPPGCLLRWQLARLNAPVSSTRNLGINEYRSWPLGTLAANILSVSCNSAAEVGMFVGRTTGPNGRSVYTKDACYALHGFEEGFSGALGTLSTVIVELSAMKPLKVSVWYAIASYTIGIIICLLVVGAPWWAIGFEGGCIQLLRGS